MAPLQLILTRHGETLENQRDILQGQLPGTLSPLGIRQAQDLAERLKGEPLEAVVASDLARSIDTAQAIALLHGLIPHQTPLLREMDWGIHTGGRLKHLDWLNLPPSVESLEALYARAQAFIDYLVSHFPGQTVVAVGHGAFNRAIITCIEKRPPIAMISLPIMENTALARFTLSPR